MNTRSIKSPMIRLLGRMDLSGDCVYLDWTGSGFEAKVKSANLWAEMDCPAETPSVWVAALVDGAPVARFAVGAERRFYPLALDMDATIPHTVSLVKETQAMFGAPEATVRLYNIRLDGELLPPPEPAMRIEFVGDSLTTAQGALGPYGNNEWLTMWFSACANFSHFACRELNAERRVVAHSGWGVLWDYLFDRKSSIAGIYERVVGLHYGLKAETRGCQKPYDFASWQPDVVCVNLLGNDVTGLRKMGNTKELRAELTEGCISFIKNIRRLNPSAMIVWILPDEYSEPNIGIEAVKRCRDEGLNRVYAYTPLPYRDDPASQGAQHHPNNAYYEREGKHLARAIQKYMAAES